MKNWSSIAKAAGLDIPETEVARSSQTLKSLDEAFRPLAATLTPEMDPAFIFRADLEQA